ncbi:WD40-repeat-containing domain protein, partial [Ochromonadaceae sp. CCMP2298]
MNREISSVRECDPVRVQRNIVGSRYLLESFEIKSRLEGHSGCVNTVLFSQEGNHIYTGSDDTNVNIYSLSSSEMVDSFSTIHTNNIFYAKDLPGTNMEVIVTCAADGRVGLTHAFTKRGRRIYRHRGRAHRIGLVPGEDSCFYSCGEDGACCLFDVRGGASQIFRPSAETSSTGGSALGDDEEMLAPVAKTVFCNNRDKRCSIYSVGVNPMRTHEVAVAGSCSHIALYDARKFASPFAYLCPLRLSASSAHVTGLKYDHSGDMIIGSYNDEEVYSFFPAEHGVAERRRPSDLPAAGARTGTGTGTGYSGHRNSNTVKQVSFLGARSEYVVSGSDCGHLFFWDTHTGQTLQMLHADKAGAINCLATHPYLPILASSGLESDAKIW